MGARTGEQYRESIRVNQPVVFLNGERVADVTTHPTFRGPLRSIMEQYDLQWAGRTATSACMRRPRLANRSRRHS